VLPPAYNPGQLITALVWVAATYLLGAYAARRRRELQAAHNQLQAALSELTRREQRVAAELHDDTLQALTAALVTLDTAPESHTDPKLAQVRAILHTALDGLGRRVFQLHSQEEMHACMPGEDAAGATTPGSLREHVAR
jgi:signal transduction histidine kinase